MSSLVLIRGHRAAALQVYVQVYMYVHAQALRIMYMLWWGGGWLCTQNIDARTD